MGSNQTYKLLHSKGNHNKTKKTIYGLGENICKQRFNFQNTQAAHTTQYQKNNQPNQKNGQKT